MENIFVEFLPPWVETGLQPAFYDKESGTVLQQTARMYDRVNMIVRMFNKLSKNTKTVVEEYINKFNELHDYVYDYFDNLDVQEEINNKLDAMVEDGTLEEIIGHYIQRPASRTENGTVIIGNGIDVDEDGKISRDYTPVKFHSVKASSSTFILQLPNGKNMIVDSGKAEEWDDIKDAIDALGITKFDYAITTHFHPDHDGNNQNLIDNYDFTDCTWWIQMKPDYVHYASRVEDSETAYNNAVYVLTSNGIAPIVPLNGSEVVLDEDAGIKIQFFNTDSSVAENYYSRIREYGTTGQINFNAFSLIANVTYGNQSILFTGDIEEYVEEQYAKYMKKATIMTAPHHGVNTEAYEAFYTATSPEITICQFITTSPNWVESYYKEFYYITENSKKVVTAYNSKSDDEFYTFALDGDSIVTNVEDGGLTEASPAFKLGSYIHVDSLIDTTKVAKDAITFKDWVLNLPKGCTASIPFYTVYATRYAQLVTDIKVFYPTLHDDFVINITRNSMDIFIEIIEMYDDFSAKIHVSETTWNSYDTASIIKNYMVGSGTISGDGVTTLLNKIAGRPSGMYRLLWKDSNNSDMYNGYYEGIIKIVMESTRTSAFFTAHLKNTSTSITSKTCLIGYVDDSATNKVAVTCW